SGVTSLISAPALRRAISCRPSTNAGLRPRVSQYCQMILLPDTKASSARGPTLAAASITKSNMGLFPVISIPLSAEKGIIAFRNRLHPSQEHRCEEPVRRCSPGAGLEEIRQAMWWIGADRVRPDRAHWQRREFGMPGEEGFDLVLVLGRKQRA